MSEWEIWSALLQAVSAGGAGAIFWMWVTALIGSSTAFIEATLAQIHKEKILYTEVSAADRHIISMIMWKAGPEERKCVLPAVLFAISGLICWCGISQVISNSSGCIFKMHFLFRHFIRRSFWESLRRLSYFVRMRR